MLDQVAPLSSEYSHLITEPRASEPNTNVPELLPLQTVAFADKVPPTVVGSIYGTTHRGRLGRNPTFI